MKIFRGQRVNTLIVIRNFLFRKDLHGIFFFFRFVPDKGFTGADSSRRRDGPVQFERYEEEDPFGLDKFLKEAKTGQKRGADDSRSSRDYDRKKRRE